jgi:hypothetical protein
VRITLFTVEEANAMLEELRRPLEKLRAQKRQFERLETRIEVLLIATAGANSANPDSLELRSMADKRRRLGETISRGIARLEDKGVVVKDLDRGLCDFYSLNGDQLIFLCWHLGEASLSHWHTLADGFAGRRPLKSAELE